MNIILYKNTAEVNRVNKTAYITEVLSLEGTLREECSLITPSISVHSNGLIIANYAYIPEFNRYYFITDITSVRNGLWRIDMQVDVLMSFKDNILNLQCAVVRNENEFDLRIIDNELPVSFTKYSNIVDSVTTKFNVTDAVQLGNAFYVTVVSSQLEPLPSDPNEWVDGYTDGILNVPSQILYPSKYTIKVYRILQRNDLLKFMDTILSDTTKVQYVLNMCILPLNDVWGDFKTVTAMLVGNTVIRDVYVGILIVENNKNDNKNILTYYSDYFVNRSITFLDFKPYTEYSIYIPFYGWYSIPIDIVQNKRLCVRYSFNFLDGKSVIQLFTSSNSNTEAIDIIDTLEVELGINVPITYTNSVDRQRITAMNSLSFLQGALSGAGQIVSGGILAVAGGSPITMAAGASQVASGAVTMVNAGIEWAKNEIANVDSGGALQAKGSFSKMFGCLNILIRKTSVQNLVESQDLSNYRRLYGIPLNKVKKLNELTGYTKIANTHLEDFTFATSTELSILETMLYSGFIL